MWELGTSWWGLVVRTAIIYTVFFLALRLFGKRELGQFTVFDVALVLLVANALQPAMTGPDHSVSGGLIIIATAFLLNRMIAGLRTRSRLFRRALELEPTILGRQGRWFADVVRREGLDEADLEQALRQHGLEDVSRMKLAVLEEDGSISIVPYRRGAADQPPRDRRPSR